MASEGTKKLHTTRKSIGGMLGGCCEVSSLNSVINNFKRGKLKENPKYSECINAQKFLSDAVIVFTHPSLISWAKNTGISQFFFAENRRIEF